MLNRIALAFIFSLPLLVLSPTNIHAQETLTVEQAIELALKNNYDIQIAKNRVEIASLNNTVGNAGMLPKANITVSDNATLSHLDQKLANGTETVKDNTWCPGVCCPEVCFPNFFNDTPLEYVRVSEISAIQSMNSRNLSRR